MRFLRHLSPLLVALIITGCSHSPVQEQVQSGNTSLWHTHKAQITPIDSWQLSGKLGVKAQTAQKTESGSATLFWLQRPGYYDIRLSGPLGRGATRLIGNSDGVELSVAGQGVFQAQSAEALLEEQLGWRLPVDHLLWWARGLAAPDSPSTLEIDDQGRLKKLTQAQWHIDYLSYSQQGNLWLPERLKVNGPNLNLTLVIKEWQARTLGQ